MTRVASVFAWLERRFDSAEPEGQNRAAEAIIDVVKKADLDRVYAKVYILGSRPHLVCASLSLKLLTLETMLEAQASHSQCEERFSLLCRS